MLAGVRTLVVLLLLAVHAESAWWSRQNPSAVDDNALANYRPPLELDAPGSERGSKLLEDLKKKLDSSCWHQAYSSLFASCRDIVNDEEKKMRMAYKFVDCFLRSTGKDPLRPCPNTVAAKQCTKSLTDHRHSLLLQFFVDLASMCHHLQSETFKLETEVVINDLKNSAHWMDDNLKTMQDQAKNILENTDKIFGLQQRLHTEYSVMEENLSEMQEGISSGISYLKKYADDTQKQLNEVNSYQKYIASEQEKMAYRISSLKDKSDDINDNLVKSLNGQEKLLVGQDAAFESLNNLKTLQTDAAEESKASFQGFTREATANQIQFQNWQQELHEMHQRLAAGSSSILKSQESFVSKQALVFESLERLFWLHNAILTESRVLKTFLFYVPVALVIYLLTGSRQTCNSRALLYCGLCFTFGIEFWLIRFDSSTYTHDVDSTRFWLRTTYTGSALIYILYCIVTFRDYAILSYHILVDIQRRLKEENRHMKPFEDELNIVNIDNPIPCFIGYNDAKAKEDELSDPDYIPTQDDEDDESEYDEDGDECDFIKSANESQSTCRYALRPNCRRQYRPLALSAGMLDWETEEMFTNLFRYVDPR